MSLFSKKVECSFNILMIFQSIILTHTMYCWQLLGPGSYISLEQFWLVNGARSVQISLRIQTRTLLHWRKRYYGSGILKSDTPKHANQCLRIISKSQVGEFDQSWDSAGEWISRTRYEYCYGLWMHILARSNAKCSFCLLQMLTDGLECCGLLWCILWLILTAPIHCRGCIAETLMQCYISPNLMKKQTHLHWIACGFSPFPYLAKLFL